MADSSTANPAVMSSTPQLNEIGKIQSVTCSIIKDKRNYVEKLTDNAVVKNVSGRSDA